MSIPSRIPTPVGLFLVLVVVGAVAFITERVLRSPSGAAGNLVPVQTKITNVSETAFTISWTTESPTTGTVLVSAPEKSNRIYYDQRDAGGKLGSYTSHMITIRDAQPNTEYSMKILSNGRRFVDGDKPYELKTPQSLPPNANGLEPAYGTILKAEGLPVEGALVYLTLDGSQELSALTKSSGLWLIPLTQIRTADLANFLPVLERINETILVVHESGEITATADSLNDSPVPEMTIGQTYDFRRLNAKTPTTNTLALAPTSLPAADQLPVGGAVLGTTNKPFTVSLATPARGASLTTTLPLFSGTGVPGKFVALNIGITQPISGSVQVKPDGTWTFTPPKTLTPGKQSVTVSSVGSTGKTVAITHAFEIFKSGTQVLGDATTSGTLTPTPTIISTLSATPTPESTLSGNEIPTSGNDLPTIVLVVIGLGLLVSGGVAMAPIRLR